MRSRKKNAPFPHPPPAELGRFADGLLAPRDVIRLIGHFKRCQSCRGRVAAAVGFVRAGGGETEPATDLAELDLPLDRAIASVLRRVHLATKERERAAPLVSAILAGTKALTSLTDKERASLRGFPLVDLLLEKSRAARYSDPAEMVRWARLAVAFAETLDPMRYGWREVSDLRSRAWGEMANALRVADGLIEAERCLWRAMTLARQGSGDPFVSLRLADISSTLLSSQGHFAEATKLLEKLARSYLALGERHLAGRAYISLGLVKGYNNTQDQAVRILVKGRLLLEKGADPSLDLAAAHALALSLVDLGLPQKARRVVWESRWRYFQAADKLNLLRLDWLEGKIHLGFGEMEQAERKLRSAQEGFRREGLGYDAAMCGLDLALVLKQQNRREEVKTLARKMIGTFRRFGLDREAIAAEILCSDQGLE